MRKIPCLETNKYQPIVKNYQFLHWIINQDLEATMKDRGTWGEIVQSMISAVVKQ